MRRPPDAPAAAPLEMVTGLCFYQNRARTATRSYGMFGMQDHQNRWVCDLTEPFLVAESNFSFKHQIFRENYTAFYVCPGARLLVVDNRYRLRDGTQPGIDYRRCCHSLFQQGSYVVIRGTGYYGLNVKRVTDQGRKEFYKDSMLQFFGRHTLPRGQPPNCSVLDHQLDNVERSFELGQTPTVLRSHSRKVVFLGATESQFNSVCWHIAIHQEADEHWFEVTAPEGGRIEDVTTWETGFRLMRNRHVYERSWNSVVGAQNFNPMPFAAPPTIYGYYFLRRLLGIIPDAVRQEQHGIAEGRWNSAAIDMRYGEAPLSVPNHFLTHQADNDRDVRRYITSDFLFRDNPALNIRSKYMEQYNNATQAINYARLIGQNPNVVPPLRSPLYPPILKNNNLFYLEPQMKVVWKQRMNAEGKPVDLFNADIWQERFKIVGKEGNYKLQEVVRDHPWWSRNVTEEDVNHNKTADQTIDQWQRLGYDYMTYRKVGATQTNVTLKTLVLVPTNN